MICFFPAEIHETVLFDFFMFAVLWKLGGGFKCFFHSYKWEILQIWLTFSNIHLNWVAQPPTRKLVMNPVLWFGSIWSISSGWWDLFESFALTAAWSCAFFGEPGIPQDAPKSPWSLVGFLQKSSNFSGIWVCLTHFDIQRFQEIVIHLVFLIWGWEASYLQMT